MCLSVPEQVALIVKGIPADLAGMRRGQAWFPAFGSFGRLVVALDVPPQLRARLKAFITDCAAEWHLLFMSLHVPLRGAAMAGLFIADRAREKLLRCVSFHVSHHIALLVETLVAEPAVKGFLPGVQSHVGLLRSDRRELLATDVARPAGVAVALEMLSQAIAGLQTFPAHTTDTLGFAGVFLCVLQQKTSPMEQLSAHSAAVR